jgi:hypothetical protein
MAVANTLAYYSTATLTSVKSFIAQDPGGASNFMLFSQVCPVKIR